MTWQTNLRKPTFQHGQLRELVTQNVELLVKRAQGISCKIEREKGAERVDPVSRTVLDLVSQAVNPLKLAQMDIAFMPQL
ncbi:hypothetical protein BC831DRAFT_459457 [Entophlyctis helioformis]|nr:hypothetical protein BC831DRAFT_459457 [Entophlyctis helioformis]